MTRLVPLDGAYRVDVTDVASGRVARYPKGRDGTVSVEDPAHVRGLLAEGLVFPASTAGTAAHLPGFRCTACGRRNYFRRCGACGGDGEREG